MSKISEGNWSVGKAFGAVVTDQTPSWYKGPHTGHDDKSAYGGFLIAESIANKADANLIAAAPQMLETLRLVTNFLLKIGVNAENAGLHIKVNETVKKALYSIQPKGRMMVMFDRNNNPVLCREENPDLVNTNEVIHHLNQGCEIRYYSMEEFHKLVENKSFKR